MPDVSSSEIPPHPGEVTHNLNGAIDKLRKLRDAATARGDAVGAEHWSKAITTVEFAIATVRDAHAGQTWIAKRVEPCSLCKR